jgi:hypothetical protein
MKVTDYVGLAVGGAVVYGLYKLFGSDSAPAKQAADKVANAIAQPYVAFTNWLYGSYATVPTGNVILPNGTKVPVANLKVTWDDASNVASFVYNGYGYIIRPNPDGGPAYDANGDYHAE